jgi:signal transduction histidine kinase
MMLTFFLTALPAALVAAATVVYLYGRLGEEIQRRGDEVALSTRTMIRSELDRVAKAVETFSKSEDLRQSVDQLEHGVDDEDEATRIISRNRVLSDGAKALGLEVLALVEAKSNDEAVIVASAHLPMSVGDDAPRFLLSLESATATAGFGHELVSGNPLAWSPVILAARTVPSSSNERSRFVLYGGSRFDLRLEEAASSNGARLLLDSPPLGRLTFPAVPTFEVQGDSGRTLLVPTLARGREPTATARPFVDPDSAQSGPRPTVVHVYVDTTHLQQARLVATAAVLVILCIIVIALFAWTWVSRRITRPILELSDAAVQVGAGDLDVHLEARSNDEVGALMNVFNQMTKEIGESRVRLQRAERIAAWREIARRVAHEIKNPLFPIQVSMETLRKGFKTRHPDLEEIVEESTRTVLEEVRSLNRIVTEFSDFARLPAPKIEPVDPLEVLEHAYSLYKDRSDEKKSISVLLDRDAIRARALPSIDVDREQIGRALINLVKNAVEALPQKGGTVSLDAHVDERGSQKGVRLDVADTGSGMADEARLKIFTPYFTTKAQGTGLGLAIVERVVQEHHGSIDVESVLGVGTTFHVWLPASGERPT